ncbi:MAG: hypothetical protein ACJAUV_000667 [Flavobacteriales bacterium]|jgi:hypothetical protein
MEVLARYLTICSLTLLLLHCKKKESDPEPAPAAAQAGIVYSNYAKNSIVSLHANIFAPTCANSGCHDGTFPPDFRTIQSSYNTLVMHPLVKNNPNNDYAYRVVPNDVNNSVLYRRLTEDIDGQSGIMPLYSGDEWANVKQEHIDNVVSWINNGALDMFDNPYEAGNQAPQMKGVIAYSSGNSNPVNRQSNGHLEIPSNSNDVTIWFSFDDDQTNASDFSNNTVKFSTQIFDFESSTPQALLTDQSITATGYLGTQVNYTHRIQIDPSIFPLNKPIYIRVYVNDGENDTELPSEGSPSYIKVYFSLKRI